MILASVFRNSADYLDRYQTQVEKLRANLDEPLVVVAVEGDSQDDTWRLLQDTDFYVLKCEHGGPSFGSINEPTRWRQIAAACNVAMIAATRMARPREAFCYVESDLIWDPDTMLRLVDDLIAVPAVAPMSMCGDSFYDVYGYRKNGVRFSHHEPYCDDWDSETLIPIDSSGSCFVTTGEHLGYANFSPVDCILGIGRSLRDNDVQLYLDPTVAVYHP